MVKSGSFVDIGVVLTLLANVVPGDCWIYDAFLPKCCPHWEIFSEYGNSTRIDCVESSPSSMYIYVRNESAVGSGLPMCTDPMDVTTTLLLSGFAPDEYLGLPACVEILREEISDQSLPIIVHCRSSQDREESNVSSTSALLPPILPTLRRCCPRGNLYDRRLKTCIDAGNDYERHEDQFFSLLPQLGNLLILTRGPPTCHYGVIFDFEIDRKDVIFENETLRVRIKSLDDESKENVTPTMEGNACFELTDPNRLILRICKERKYCESRACVQKCCPEGSSFVAGVHCVKANASRESLEFHPTLRNHSNITDFDGDYGVLAGNPCKLDMFVMDDAAWHLVPTGHLYVEGYNVYGYKEHCLEVLRCSDGYEDGIYPFVCFKQEDQEDDISSSIRFGVTTVLELTSCAFLAITLLVYICLPALQNLHGKTLMCHVASLLLAYCNLALIAWITPTSVHFVQLEQSSITVVCKFLGYTMLFSFLSAFSWLNVMCFDIWWTFGGMRGSTSKGRGHRRRFLLYCLYAWGLALVISSLAIAVDYTDILPVYVRPNIAEVHTCWFQKDRQYFGEIAFFFGPIILQLTMNIIFFALTAVHCNMVKAEIRRLTVNPMDPRNKRFHADKTKLIMNVKLFIVMGISWTMEVASFFLNKYGKEFQWREELFYATDAFNCLQGLLIFILFVLKTRVYVALRKRLGLNDKKKVVASNATTAVQDPYRVKKSASNSTLMSTFGVSASPLST